MTNKEYADSLRLVADFYEANPSFPLPYNIIFGVRVGLRGFSLADAARALGNCKKDLMIQYPQVSRKFGQIEIQAWDAKENVCEKIVVGKEKRIEKVPVQYEEKEVEVEIVEWKCPESLLNGNANEAL